MDAVTTYILLGFILVVSFVWAVFGARFRQKLREKGRASGFALDDLMAKGDAARLGTTLAVKDGQAAAQHVFQVVSQTKGITPLESGRWNLRYANPDDLVVVWTVDQAGQGILQVQSAREMLGQLIGGGVWLKLVKSVEAQLDAIGVGHERQPGTLEKTDQQSPAGDTFWKR